MKSIKFVKKFKFTVFLMASGETSNNHVMARESKQNLARKVGVLILTDRGSLPGHTPGLVGGRAQLLEAQGGGQRRERLVLEQLAGLKAALPQNFVVLVQVLHRLAVRADALVLLPAVLQGGRDARHDAGSRSGSRGSWKVWESLPKVAGWRWWMSGRERSLRRDFRDQVKTERMTREISGEYLQNKKNNH